MHERLADACRMVLLAAIAGVSACGDSSPSTAKSAAVETPPGASSLPAGTRVPSPQKPRAVPEGDKPLSDIHDLVPRRVSGPRPVR